MFTHEIGRELREWGGAIIALRVISDILITPHNFQ